MFSDNIMTLVIWIAILVDTCLAFAGVVLVIVEMHRTAADRVEYWNVINGLREAVARSETRDDAKERASGIWQAIETIRRAVADLNTLAAGRYVTREELSAMINSLKTDLHRMHEQAIIAIRGKE